MAIYQVQVRFLHHDVSSTNLVWLPVASASNEKTAREYASMWRPSVASSESIVGVRIMKDGKEVKL